MRKIAVALAVVLVLLVLVGCGGGNAGSADETTTSLAPSGGLVTTSSNDTAATTEGGGSGSESTQAFEPNQLLSAEEASAIAGHPITMDDGSLFKDPESGVISERYKYDLESSTIHALVEIHQDSFKTSDGSVKDAFLFEKDLSKAEITAVDLGDDAFTAGEGQLHMLYDGYYVIVAFDADPYSSDQNAPLNIELGKKILENLKAKLQ
jgi:pectate lyase